MWSEPESTTCYPKRILQIRRKRAGDKNERTHQGMAILTSPKQNSQPKVLQETKRKFYYDKTRNSHRGQEQS